MKENKIFLNGEWDFMPIYDDPFSLNLPKDIVYEKEKFIAPSSWREHIVKIDEYGYDPMSVFNYPEAWNKAESGVLHRTFELPKSMRNKRVFLNFDAVAQQCAVYLNGEKIKEWNEAFLPFSVEITNAVKHGLNNDLFVVCASFNEVEIASGEKKTTGLMGSIFGKCARGIWQDVYLSSKPKTYIDDFEIVTSVRNKRISVYVKLKGDDIQNATLVAKICDGDKTIKAIEQAVVFSKMVELSAEWLNPIYWDTDNPHLYNLTLSLIKGGEKLDEIESRFGFREFWAQNQNFYLNGTKINLRGDSWHFHGPCQQTKEYALNWCKICKEHGVNSIRYHAEPHPSYYLDAADETGVLIVDETAIYGSGKTMDCSHKDYLENCRHHIRELVRRDKNHPSVVIWSLQNEMRWADGRDEYKKHVPELMDIFHKYDKTQRLIVLDGDNRLIDEDHTEIESRHYNIDGTLEQWTRKTPLTVGEHGDAWALTPQDTSMYFGQRVYHDSEYSAEANAYKEKLFIEHARKQGVSGISSFNFAYYYAKNMPNEDLSPILDDAPAGVKPRVIKKYSLTVNNGTLPKDYPCHIENSACAYITEAMRPVTIIFGEYDHSFYDDKSLPRTLHIFNDTLYNQSVTLKIVAEQGGKVIFSFSEEFEQGPAEQIVKQIELTPEKVSEKTALELKCALYHGKKQVFTVCKHYNIYPSSIRAEAVLQNEIAFFGSEREYHIIKNVLPSLKQTNICENEIACDVLILGSFLAFSSEALHEKLDSFVKKGGKLLILEQDAFTFGSPILTKKKFFSAHTYDYSHPALKNLSGDDFIFWEGTTDEAGPLALCTAAFEKSPSADYSAILESSLGSWNMDGDYWTPLIEYKDNGLVVACQLKISEYFDKVPAAAILLKNLIEYVAEYKNQSKKAVAFLSEEDALFINKLGVECSFESTPINNSDIIIVSPSKLVGLANSLKKACEKGATVFVMPSKNRSDGLDELFLEEVEIKDRYTYILNADYTDKALKCVSVVDLFGLDKANITQRVVDNRKMAEQSIYAKGARTLLESIEGTTWEDNFVNKYSSEIFLRALVEYNRENKREPASFMISKELGKGKVYACQFVSDINYVKSVRVYSKMFDNLGVPFKKDSVLAKRGDEAHAVEAMMVLPYRDYINFDEMFAYFSDKDYTLNNLGEGAYGWMNRIDRDENGYLFIRGSSDEAFFMTSFVKSDGGDYILETSGTRKYVVYVNGKKVENGELALISGLNKLFIYSKKAKEDFAVKVVFKNKDGGYATDLSYSTTVDEIEPK